MAYLVLARKYRPQTFADLVGQEHISRTLSNAIQLGRVAHAFLFTGVRGVGKTTAARILAKALNCEKGPTPEPCGQCISCQEITQGISADVLEIDGASNRGIDSIRELRESVRYLPRQGSFRIFIIDEVHMLTQESFNALLKTLEEPPAHVKFIFATTEPHKIPVTILSRCQRYDFHRIPAPELTRRIEEILKAEGISIAPAGIARIARAAEGSARDALSLLDQVISFAGEKVSAEAVSEALGSVDRTELFSLARAVLERQPGAVLTGIERVFRRGYDLGQFAEDLLAFFRDLVAVKAGADPAELGEEDKKEILELVKAPPLPELIRAFQLLSKACEEIARAANPKVLLEVALVKLATLPPLLPWEELLARLEKLEARLESGGGAGGSSMMPPSSGSRSSSPRGDGFSSAPVELPSAGLSTSLERSFASPPVNGAASTRAQASRKDDSPFSAVFSALEQGEEVRRSPAPPPPPAPSEGPPIEASAWESAVRQLRERSPLIGSVLERGAFLKATHSRVTLAFPPGSFELENLQDTEKRKAVEHFLTEYFRRPVSVELVERVGAERETLYAKGEQKAVEERNRRKRATIEHPSVKDALRIFQIDDTSVTPKLEE